MGRLFVVEFDEDKYDYYMCKLCRTHIALREDCIYFYESPDDGDYGCTFLKAVNVHVEKAVHGSQVFSNTVTNIYCVKCGEILGCKVVEFAPWLQTDSPNELVLLYVLKLSRRLDNVIMTGDMLVAQIEQEFDK